MNIIKSAILATSIIFSGSILAEESFELDCNYISNIAGQVMEARQAGFPMRELIEEAGENAILIYLTEEAYKYSVLPSPEYAQKYVSQYSDRIYQECRAANKLNKEKAKKKGQRV